MLFNEIWDRNRRGLGSGVVQAMAAAGTALASLVAAFALTHFAGDVAWRIGMAVGGLPLFLMLFVRAKMPESRLWAEYDRLRRRGELPPEKRAERSPLIEILRGASGRFFLFGTIMAGGYVIAYQSATVFTPLLMGRVLGAGPLVIRDVSLLWAAVLAAGLLLSGYVSDRWGRKLSVLSSATVCALGFVAIFMTGASRYDGTIWGWPLFWAYLLWGLGQGGAGQFGPWLAELYPVELRTTAASTIYTAGRLIGSAAPYIVPVLAAAFGDLLDAMMFGLLGVAASMVATLMLPETAGRRFAVIEARLQDGSPMDLARAE